MPLKLVITYETVLKFGEPWDGNTEPSLIEM